MKFIKTFEEKDKKVEHAPRYKYDCENCKFNWCCGFDSNCILHYKPDPPKDSLYVASKNYNL